jgi:uncharacterized protein
VSAGAGNAAAPAPRRFVSLDALRGFALFGIIIVNAPFLARPMGDLYPATAIDTAAIMLTAVFAMGKFFIIFSFLFGFGFAMSHLRGAEPGGSARGRVLRRMVGLFAFGALHACLLFFGDILMLYALLGSVLWLCRTWPMRRLMIAAAITYALAVPVQVGILAVAADGAAAASSASAAATAAYLGGFGSGMQQRLAELPDALGFIVFFNGLPALAMFFAGASMGLSGRFPPDAAQLKALRPKLVVAFFAGALISGAGVIMTVSSTANAIRLAGLIAMCGAAPLLSFSMAGLFLNLAESLRHTRTMRWLAVAGSSSLSGYILHSAILGAVFYGWGFGLYGRLGDMAVLLIGCATFAFIVLALNLWRIWFRFGPDEWLLRSFVDLQWKPILNNAGR